MPTTPFSPDFFEPVMIDLFWQLIVERQRIYWRRLEGEPPPWTSDPILRSEFITNVYRELDPGTQYLISEILEYEDELPEDKLFNIMFYRLIGSRQETHEEVGFLRLAEFDAEELGEALRTLRDEKGMVPFGEAYRTAAYTDMGTKDKCTNVALLFGEIAENMPVIWQQIQAATKLQEVYAVLESIRGFGDFLAYQIMVDCLYKAPYEPLVPYTENDWAQAGPGARRGIWKLLRPGVKPNALLDVMRWLRDNQEQEFARLGLEMNYLKDEDGNDILITLTNIQSCLCEYFKYVRIWEGELKYARKYTYGEPLLRRFDEPSVVVVTPPSKVEGVGQVVVGTVRPEDASGGEHLVLGGPAGTGGELLELGGGHEVDQEALTPEGPQHYPGHVVGSQVHELAASGSTFDDDERRLMELCEAANLSPDQIAAVFQFKRGRGLALTPVHGPGTVVYNNQSGAGQGQVPSEDIQVMIRAPRQVSKVVIQF